MQKPYRPNRGPIFSLLVNHLKKEDFFFARDDQIKQRRRGNLKIHFSAKFMCEAPF